MKKPKLKRCCQARFFALILWLMGFAWGSIVFAMPQIMDLLPPIPYFSPFPIISIPLVILYLILAYYYSRRYLSQEQDKTAAGRKLGITFFLLNAIPDLIVYFFIFHNRYYFFAASVWVAYAVLLFVPWFLGRRMSEE